MGTRSRGIVAQLFDGRGARVRSSRGESERFYSLAAARYILSKRLSISAGRRTPILYVRDAHHLDTDQRFSSDRSDAFEHLVKIARNFLHVRVGLTSKCLESIRTAELMRRFSVQFSC